MLHFKRTRSKTFISTGPVCLIRYEAVCILHLCASWEKTTAKKNLCLYHTYDLDKGLVLLWSRVSHHPSMPLPFTLWCELLYSSTVSPVILTADAFWRCLDAECFRKAYVLRQGKRQNKSPKMEITVKSDKLLSQAWCVIWQKCQRHFRWDLPKAQLELDTQFRLHLIDVDFAVGTDNAV